MHCKLFSTCRYHFCEPNVKLDKQQLSFSIFHYVSLRVKLKRLWGGEHHLDRLTSSRDNRAETHPDRANIFNPDRAGIFT